jgi:hypothetical protein
MKRNRWPHGPLPAELYIVYRDAMRSDTEGTPIAPQPVTRWASVVTLCVYAAALIVLLFDVLIWRTIP